MNNDEQMTFEIILMNIVIFMLNISWTTETDQEKNKAQVKG